VGIEGRFNQNHSEVVGVSKIMVVDDEEKIRYVVRKILEGKGYEVIDADGGKQCLEILKNEKPDMILMDILMPGMNGWEVVKEVKEDWSNKYIMICMLTVKSTGGDREKSLVDTGADWHISKPIPSEDLLEAVRWLLTRPFDKLDASNTNFQRKTERTVI
jgi:two-component system alkaline phosphatase synthesis response regulator PhoP